MYFMQDKINTEKQELLSSKSQKENEKQNLNNLKQNLSQKEQAVLIEMLLCPYGYSIKFSSSTH